MTYPRSYRYRCEPAGTVIRALGGARKCAARLGVSTETCSQWNRPAERGGTGGYIPKKYWTEIQRLAREGGHKITEKLLKSGKREKDVGAMSRRKGALFENQVVKDLCAEGLKARRVPLSGAAVGWPGDVVVDLDGRQWVLQCKIDGIGAGGRQKVLRALSQVAWLRVRIDDTTLLAMRRDLFVEWLRGEPPRGMNVTTIKVSGKTILRHLEGHDALVFRRSGTVEWMALVREDAS